MTHFTQYSYIDEPHKPILDKIVDAHPGDVDSRLLAMLYRDAHDSLNGVNAKPASAISRFSAGEIQVATATDTETGVYLQLASVVGIARPMLTVGRKWAMENPNKQVGNVATILW